jgi:hypothetical protein
MRYLSPAKDVQDRLNKFEIAGLLETSVDKSKSKREDSDRS